MVCKKRKVVITDVPEREEVWQSEEIGSSDENEANCCCCCCCLCCSSCSPITMDRIKVVLLLLGVVLGIGFGVGLWYVTILDDPMLGPRLLRYIRLPSELIISLTTIVALPLTITSLVSGITALKPIAVSRLMFQTLTYQLCTGLIAIGECLGAYYVMRTIIDTSGDEEPFPGDALVQNHHNVTDFFIDVVRNFFPDNLIEAWFTLKKTERQTSNNTTVTFEQVTIPGVNYTGLIVFSVIFALITTLQPSMVQQVIQQLFNALFQVFMGIIQVILWIYPIALISLLGCEVAECNLTQFTSLIIYCLTAFAAMLIHFLITLPIIYLIFTRKNPYRHMFNMSRALFVAFTTGSSSIAMPTSLSCLDNIGLRRIISRFVIPVGTNLNIDGTALTQPLMVLFVMQEIGQGLTIWQTIQMALLVISVTFAAPSIGKNGYHTLAFSLAISPKSFHSVISVGWLISRLRAVVSVWSDCIACGVLERLSLKVLMQRTSSLPRNQRGTLSPSDIQLIGARGVLQERNHYTLTVENESGERIKVSKV